MKPKRTIDKTQRLITSRIGTMRTMKGKSNVEKMYPMAKIPSLSLTSESL